ncbi:MAG TPA: MmgE/PrpD family protein [Syntrophorhabdaceae bacterium]|nr:MmgE/PrpD family protein [Syntrophorhabdaceae bacterium]
MGKDKRVSPGKKDHRENNPTPALRESVGIKGASGTNRGRDAAFDLAQYVVNTAYADLPGELVEMTKRCILDTLGVTIAASTLDAAAKEIVELIKEGGGKQESTILGFGGKLPCWMAAFVNGAMGHMVDYDDMHMMGKIHSGVTTVLPGLAIAERIGKVTGRDFIAAVALGNDIMVRLGRAITLSPQGRDEWTMDKGWFSTQLFGFISGAATVGKLLKLSEEQMIDAFGIAFAQLSGSRQMGTGFAAETRAIQAAWTGKGAVLSALLAKRGITGSRDSFEGKYGLYRVYLQADPDRDSLVGALGRRFDGMRMQFKPWPACGATHPVIYSTLEIMREHGLKAKDVEEVRIVGGSPHTRLLSEPIESKRQPKTAIDGKYSIPFTVAIAVAKGNVTLHDYTPEGLNDPTVLKIAQRITYHYVPEVAGKREEESPVVEIRVSNGALYRRQDEIIYGMPEKAVSGEDLMVKFKDCLSFSAIPIRDEDAVRAADMIGKLETIPDVSQVIDLLGGSAS